MVFIYHDCEINSMIVCVCSLSLGGLSFFSIKCQRCFFGTLNVFIQLYTVCWIEPFEPVKREEKNPQARIKLSVQLKNKQWILKYFSAKSEVKTNVVNNIRVCRYFKYPMQFRSNGVAHSREARSLFEIGFVIFFAMEITDNVIKSYNYDTVFFLCSYFLAHFFACVCV